MAIIDAAKATVTLSQINCGQCGGVYAIQEVFRARCQAESKHWHCPYCQTGWGYFGDTPAQKLEKELTRERARHDQTKAECEHLERRRRAEKAAKTRIKNRVANGVCPCCQRTFQDLMRHMKNQHPEFAGSDS